MFWAIRLLHPLNSWEREERAETIQRMGCSSKGAWHWYGGGVWGSFEGDQGVSCGVEALLLSSLQTKQILDCTWLQQGMEILNESNSCKWETGRKSSTFRIENSLAAVIDDYTRISNNSQCDGSDCLALQNSEKCLVRPRQQECQHRGCLFFWSILNACRRVLLSTSGLSHDCTFEILIPNVI